MKRTILNMLALTLVLGGASHLNAQQDEKVAGPICCSGGGFSCCGANGCEAGQSGCSAW